VLCGVPVGDQQRPPQEAPGATWRERTLTRVVFPVPVLMKEAVVVCVRLCGRVGFSRVGRDAPCKGGYECTLIV
jgi:hypothetical protein